MNRINSYFEYRIPLTKNMNSENSPFIVDSRTTEIKLPMEILQNLNGYYLKCQYSKNTMNQKI